MAFTLDLRKKKAVSEPEPEKPQLPESPAAGERPEIPAQVLTWEFDRQPPNRKKSTWLAGALVLAALALFYFASDYLFGILLLLCAFVVFANSFRRAERSSVRLDKISIAIDDQRHPFSQFKSFWINYDPPRQKELILVSQKPLVPVVRIPLESANPLEIRKNMVSLIPEKEYEDSLMDHLVRKLES